MAISQHLSQGDRFLVDTGTFWILGIEPNDYPLRSDTGGVILRFGVLS